MKFLPIESNFKSTVANKDLYRRIRAALQDPLTEACTSFCAYSTTEFEDFLPFQSYEPRIHMLYDSMCKLVSSLQQKFIGKKLLSGVDSKNIFVDIHFQENRKALQFVDIGTKAKNLLNELTHQLKIALDKLDKFRKDCLNFYLYARTHLFCWDSSFFHVPVIKHAQYLPPCKRNNYGATNAISNLSLCMMSVLTNKLSEVFHNQSPITSKAICSKIRAQWMRLQAEPSQDEWFKNLLEQIDCGTSNCSTTQ